MTTIMTMVLSTMLTGALSQVWGLINGLQLIVHLPLVGKATFPVMTDQIFEIIIAIAQFDLIDSEAYIFRGLLDMEIPESYEDYHIYALEHVTYESSFTILNLGTLYLIFAFLCIEAFLLFLCKPLYWCSLRVKKWA